MTIKYIGSKKKLIPHILSAVKEFSPRGVLDPFCGSGRVSHACFGEGWDVNARIL